MYKIQRNPFDGLENTIIRKSDGAFIPRDTGNRDYQQFIEDTYTHGIGIVEGADYVGVTTYTEARAVEYPPIVDQLDKIYHSGIDAWKADIKTIKDKYPKTQVGITSIAPIPDWVNTALFDKQKEKYVEATGSNRFYTWAVPPGLNPRWSDEHIELMSNKVIPEFKK